jgi:hypothetical protein
MRNRTSRYTVLAGALVVSAFASISAHAEDRMPPANCILGPSLRPILDRSGHAVDKIDGSIPTFGIMIEGELGDDGRSIVGKVYRITFKDGGYYTVYKESGSDLYIDVSDCSDGTVRHYPIRPPMQK